jgi:hypothetical protein
LKTGEGVFQDVVDATLNYNLGVGSFLHDLKPLLVDSLEFLGLKRELLSNTLGREH